MAFPLCLNEELLVPVLISFFVLSSPYLTNKTASCCISLRVTHSLALALLLTMVKRVIHLILIRLGWEISVFLLIDLVFLPIYFEMLLSFFFPSRQNLKCCCKS